MCAQVFVRVQYEATLKLRIKADHLSSANVYKLHWEMLVFSTLNLGITIITTGSNHWWTFTGGFVLTGMLTWKFACPIPFQPVLSFCSKVHWAVRHLNMWVRQSLRRKGGAEEESVVGHEVFSQRELYFPWMFLHHFILEVYHRWLWSPRL